MAGSRSEDAYWAIRNALRLGEFRPGDRLREADLAEKLGISRTPVREALRRLLADGLVTSLPHQTGLVVTTLDQEKVAQIYAVRDVLEGLVGRLAASSASDGEVAVLREMLDQQESTDPTDTEELARLNEIFHAVLYRCARNQYLLEILSAFESTLALLPGTTYASPGRALAALSDHAQLVAAIEQHDPTEAERAAREHIRAAGRIRLSMIANTWGAGIGRVGPHSDGAADGGARSLNTAAAP